MTTTNTGNSNDNANENSAKKEEASIPQAFAKFWTEEKYDHDVTLKANDDLTVTANRAALATCCEVFDKMLYGSFSEGCNGLVLRELLEYIHTDTAQILATILDAATRIHTLVELSEATEYFNVPLLCKKVKNCLAETIDATTSLGIEVLKACDRVGQSVPKCIKWLSKLIMQFVKFDLSEISTNLSSLSPSALETILKHEFTCMDEIDLFKMLKLWTETDQTNENIVAMDPPENKRPRFNKPEDQKTIALDLKKHIRLER